MYKKLGYSIEDSETKIFWGEEGQLTSRVSHCKIDIRLKREKK